MNIFKKDIMVKLIEKWLQGDDRAGTDLIFKHFYKAIYSLSVVKYHSSKINNEIDSILEGVAKANFEEKEDVFIEFLLFLKKKKNIFKFMLEKAFYTDLSEKKQFSETEMKRLVYRFKKGFIWAARDFGPKEAGLKEKKDKTNGKYEKKIITRSLDAPVNEDGKTFGEYIGIENVEPVDSVIVFGDKGGGVEQKEQRRYKKLSNNAKKCINDIEDKSVKAVLMAHWIDLFDITPETIKEAMEQDQYFEYRFDELKKEILKKHVKSKENKKILLVYKVSESEIKKLLNLTSNEYVRNLLKRAKRHVGKWSKKHKNEIFPYLNEK